MKYRLHTAAAPDATSRSFQLILLHHITVKGQLTDQLGLLRI